MNFPIQTIGSVLKTLFHMHYLSMQSISYLPLPENIRLSAFLLVYKAQYVRYLLIQALQDHCFLFAIIHQSKQPSMFVICWFKLQFQVLGSSLPCYLSTSPSSTLPYFVLPPLGLLVPLPVQGQGFLGSLLPHLAGHHTGHRVENISLSPTHWLDEYPIEYTTEYLTD